MSTTPLGLPTEALLESVEARRVTISGIRDEQLRAMWGQFFTPARAADLIVSFVTLPEIGELRILDPGAGVGSLTAAIVARVIRDRPHLKLSICTIEIDASLRDPLKETLRECQVLAEQAGVTLTTEVLTDDFVTLSADWSRPLFDRFDLVIMNPPYRKLGARSPERQALSGLGIDSPNLYSAFLALGALALVPGGQMVAITPRSFTNGPYFASFRRFLLDQVTLDHLHVFESRSTVFSDTGVLQENIVFSAHKKKTLGQVRLSVSNGHVDEHSTRFVPYEEIVRTDDRARVIHLPTDERDTQITQQMEFLSATLEELGVQVSTGKVVDFRAREYLLPDYRDGAAPLIYPSNLRAGNVCWPLPIRKHQALDIGERTTKLLLPNERFVLVKRFSAKEEKRRVVAAISEPATYPTDIIAFENHLNVFHDHGRGLPEDLARGLCLWLNSTIVDRFFRTFSGHTQVNATDLRSMRYPSRDQLVQLGAISPPTWPDQSELDKVVDQVIIAGLGA